MSGHISASSEDIVSSLQIIQYIVFCFLFVEHVAVQACTRCDPTTRSEWCLYQWHCSVGPCQCPYHSSSLLNYAWTYNHSSPCPSTSILSHGKFVSDLVESNAIDAVSSNFEHGFSMKSRILLMIAITFCR